MTIKTPKILFALVFVFAYANIPANTYVVAESGGDFTSIQDALNVAHAGDTVMVRAKTEPYYEKVRFVRSGNETDGYVVLIAYPGEKPVIDGTGVSLGSDWIVGLVKMVNKNYVEINGFEIRNLITDDGDKFPAGIWVRGSSHHVRILNCEIHDIKHLDADAGAHGIAVYGTSSSSSIHDVLIEGNEIHDCVLAWSESLVLNGNVENFVVRNNVVHDNDNIAFDFIGYEGTCSNDEYDMARNGLVERNIAYNIDSRTNPAYGGEGAADGFYVDGGKDIVFDGNLAYNCNIGFELASEHAGRATSGILMRNNFMINNHAIGLAIGGYDAQRGQTKNCVIVNNTIYKNRTELDWGGEFSIQYYCENILFENNIIYSSGNAAIIRHPNSTGTNFVFDNNLYYAESNPLWIWNGAYYHSFDEFRQGANLDANSIYADPLFVEQSIEERLPEILSDSPAINAGKFFSADTVGEFDFCGNPRIYGNAIDIGACEVNNGVGVNDSETPSDFILYPPYPNPFNPVTTIRYSIPSVIASDPDLSGERGNLSDSWQNQQIASVASHPRNDANVRLIVYNILGEEIATLVNERQTPGNYSVTFDASNLPSGTYFCTLIFGNRVATQKLVLIK